MTTQREHHEQMASEDLLFAAILTVVGLYATKVKWIESDWWGFTGTVLLTLFGLFWLSARIYHLTHADEVFKHIDDEEK